MREEQRQVLDMLAEGKITAEQAEKLLEKLASAESDPPPPNGPFPFGGPMGEKPKPRPKFFRVVVNDTDGDTVNIRIPLSFVQAGIKLSTVMPMEARKLVEKRGIDLSHLSELKGEELIDALRDLTVDVNSADGDQVRIFCE